jgi:flavodoxin
MIFGSLFSGLPKRNSRILVAFASQTGAAERIAWLSANALAANANRMVRVAPLGGLTMAEIAEAGTLLVVTSTYGAGEAPDSARAFARKQMAETPQLKGLNYAVLALGDMKYDATFCGFGRGLDRWLASGKARRLFDIVCVNGDDDDAAMAKWATALTRLGAQTSAGALMPGPPQDWLLEERRLLNPDSPGGEAWHIALRPKDPAQLNWTAGDIAEIWPRNSQALVEEFLARHQLDGGKSFRWRGQWTFLSDIIAHSRLPQPHEVEGISLDWLVDRLEAFPHREYSIASLPDCGRMELLVRKAVKDTGRKFAIMYSERLEVPAAVMAGQLVDQGAIGKVVQTINIAPHRVSAPTRPDWFWDKARYGGILTDIGSHQAEQFVYYTRSTKAHVVASQTGNLTYPQHPRFEDFGDMVLSGNGGTGYVRVDWFTPDGLSTWGDGRLFILGTEGYIELRKYINVASNLTGGNHLYIVDQKQARYIDCKDVELPFGPQFVADIVNRTSDAQDQEQALLAAELVLKAQKIATRPITL